MKTYLQFLGESDEVKSKASASLKNLPDHPGLGDKFAHTDQLGFHKSTGVVRVPTVTKKLLKNSPTKTISMHDAHVGQTWINRSHVHHIINRDEHPNKNELTVVHQDGKHHIVDGNNRLAAMKLMGHTHFNAKVLEAKEKKR